MNIIQEQKGNFQTLLNCSSVQSAVESQIVESLHQLGVAYQDFVVFAQDRYRVASLHFDNGTVLYNLVVEKSGGDFAAHYIQE
jgi:hypothetical protein